MTVEAGDEVHSFCASTVGQALTSIVLYHHPSKQQASALAKAEIRAREQALADEKRKLGIHD